MLDNSFMALVIATVMVVVSTTMLLLNLASGLPAPPPTESQLTPVDVSLEPARVCAAPGETVTVYVVVTATEPEALGTVEALLQWDGLKLVGAKGVGCWLQTGFLNHPDGINDDVTNGEALFTLLATPGGPFMFATPCGTRVVELTFAGDGSVWLVDASGEYGRTRVLPLVPGLDITGANTDKTEVHACGPRRVKARRLP